MNLDELILSLAAKHSLEVKSPCDRAALLRRIEEVAATEKLRRSAAHAAAAIELSEQAQRTLFKLPIPQKPN